MGVNWKRIVTHEDVLTQILPGVRVDVGQVYLPKATSRVVKVTLPAEYVLLSGGKVDSSVAFVTSLIQGVDINRTRSGSIKFNMEQLCEFVETGVHLSTTQNDRDREIPTPAHTPDVRPLADLHNNPRWL